MCELHHHTSTIISIFVGPAVQSTTRTRKEIARKKEWERAFDEIRIPAVVIGVNQENPTWLIRNNIDDEKWKFQIIVAWPPMYSVGFRSLHSVRILKKLFQK